MDGVVTAKVERPAPPSKRRRVELMPEQEDGPPASHLSENYRDNAQEDEQEGDVTPIAGSSRARKRRPIVDSDGEGQEDGEASDDVHDASQANSDGAVEEGAEDVYLAEISDEQRKRLSKRGDDGYLPGQIVRCAFKNFLTYDWAEFFPGPHMNMVIGPNGTGKSTIVAGIALGLGWAPKLLGKGDHFQQFINNKASKSEKVFTEIEIKGFPGQGNYVIKRFYAHDSNSTTFKLNGKSATQAEVKQVVMSFNVQIGNFTSFLPQEKVAEFARLTPEQLLKETQKGAGPRRMSDWHADLIRYSASMKDVEERIEVERTNLDRKVAANERLAGEVKNALERETLASEIWFLDSLLPYTVYNAEKAIFEEYKQARNDAKHALLQAQKESGPYDDLLQDFAEMKDQITHKIKKNHAKGTEISGIQKKLIADISRMENDFDGIQTSLTEIKSNSEKRKKDIAEARSGLAKLQQKLEAWPEPEPPDEAERIKTQSTHEARECEDRLRSEVEQPRRLLSQSQADARKALERGAQDLARLNDAANARLNNLRNWPGSGDSAVLCEFLRADKRRAATRDDYRSFFKMEVFEPPCISVDVLDPRLASQLESTIGSSQMRTFVVQCEEDRQTLDSWMTTDQNPLGKRLQNLNITVISEPYRPQEPPMPQEQIQALGFSGYAINFMSAPDPVKLYLEIHAGCGRTAVSVNVIGEQPNDIKWEDTQRSNLMNFVTRDTIYSTVVSKYGAKTRASGATRIKPVRNFANKVDQERIDAIQERMTAAQAQLDATQPEHNRLDQLADEISMARDAAFTRANTAKETLLAIRRHHQDRAALIQNISVAESKISRLEKVPSEDAQKRKLQAELKATHKEKIKLDLKYKDLVTKASRIHQTNIDLTLELFQVDQNSIVVEDLREEDQRRHRGAEQAFRQADEAYKKQKTKTRACLNEAEVATDSMTEQEHDEFEMRKAALLEESGVPHPDAIENQLIELKAQLEALGAQDPGVLEKYEKGKTEIEELRTSLQGQQNQLREVQKRMMATKDKWYPALKDLISRISAKFSAGLDALSVQGEIRLREHDDYDHWAIEILVSFRDHDKLHILTSTHQSGGERALATIMYAMSLIELSTTPFTIVDEINQGMDRRVEREVHNQLVATTCAAESGQFFLMTPKLLHGLDYHDRMRVLVVCNGEWLVEREPGDTNNQLFLQKSLGAYKRKQT